MKKEFYKGLFTMPVHYVDVDDKLKKKVVMKFNHIMVRDKEINADTKFHVFTIDEHKAIIHK